MLSSIPAPAVPEAAADVELARVVQQCQKSDYVRAAWESFQVFWTEKAHTMGWSEYAIAFEICTTTLQTDRVVRLHAHASIRSASKQKLRSERILEWRGSRPHLANPVNAGREQRLQVLLLQLEALLLGRQQSAALLQTHTASACWGRLVAENRVPHVACRRVGCHVQRGMETCRCFRIVVRKSILQ